MKGIGNEGKKLSLSEKLSRLRERMKDPQWRKYSAAVFAGKMLGVVCVFAIMLGIPALLTSAPKLVSPTVAHAEEKPAPAPATTTTTTPAVTPATSPAPTTVAATTAAPATPPDPLLAVKAADIVNPLNTVWVLVAAFLVFGMQVGFTMLEAGFCRSRETVNVLVECVVRYLSLRHPLLCLRLRVHVRSRQWLHRLGRRYAGGHNWFFLQNAPATYETTGVAFLAVWIFQFAFADTCSTITSGAMIGRTGFVGDILYSHLRHRLHLSDHRTLGLGSGWLPGHDGSADGRQLALPPDSGHELP